MAEDKMTRYESDRAKTQPPTSQVPTLVLVSGSEGQLLHFPH